MNIIPIFIVILCLSTNILPMSSDNEEKEETLVNMPDLIAGLYKHHATFKKIIRDNPKSIKQKDEHGCTILAQASSRGISWAVQFLLAERADPNAADRDGFTPLMEAACRGCPKCTPFPKDERCILVSCEECLKVAQSLMRAKAHVNSTDCYGYSPLLYASMHKKFHIANYLLSQKANPNVPNQFRETPIFNAIQCRAHKTFDLLLENNAHFDAPSNIGYTPLATAILYVNPRAIITLLSRGADQNNIRNIEGNTVTDSLKKSLPYMKDKTFIRILIPHIQDQDLKYEMEKLTSNQENKKPRLANKTSSEEQKEICSSLSNSASAFSTLKK